MAQTAQVCQASCTGCGALLQFNMPSRPSTIQCYNCKALMVVQPQASSNLGAMQQMAQGGALTPHMEKKQRKKREGPPRQPTAYNNFMKAELAKIKQENAEMHHREAFKIAAARWAESQDNPKNQKGGAAVAAAAAAAAIEAPKPEQHTAEAPPASVPAAQDPVAPAAVPAPAPAPEPVPAAEAQAAEAPPAAAPAPVAAPVAAVQEPAAEAPPAEAPAPAQEVARPTE